MLTHNLSIHQTTTVRIHNPDQDGWEFVCPTCHYRARYVSHTASGAQHLEIVNIGDPAVRHTTSHVVVKPREDWPVNGADNAHEVLLSNETRQQLEDLLKDIDLGNWDV